MVVLAIRRHSIYYTLLPFIAYSGIYSGFIVLGFYGFLVLCALMDVVFVPLIDLVCACDRLCEAELVS